MTTSRFSQESLEQFGECWEGLEDPRSGNAGLHDFHELLAIALCCVLCGGQGPTDMALFARAKEPFLRGFLSLANGLPSHDTFNRLFRDLDPDQFRDSFQRFMAQFCGTWPSMPCKKRGPKVHSEENSNAPDGTRTSSAGYWRCFEMRLP